MPDIVLEYLGDSETGMPFIQDIPARDLVVDDMIPLGIEIADLVATGLYVEVPEPAEVVELDTEIVEDEDDE